MNTASANLSQAKHDHASCVAEAMSRAEMVCKQQGRKLTARRRRVLELVWDSHRPVGAYDILEALCEDGKRHAPPTVYRALDFLIEAGLVHRLDSLNAFIGCPDPSHAHVGQFLICTECRLVVELDSKDIESLVNQTAAGQGFQAESFGLEVQGCCRSCRSA